MLETCRGGPRPIRLCVEKTNNYGLKPAGEALGLLGCVLKRLKILVKFNHRGPGGQNGPKF